jgi:hypothetical protein
MRAGTGTGKDMAGGGGTGCAIVGEPKRINVGAGGATGVPGAITIGFPVEAGQGQAVGAVMGQVPAAQGAAAVFAWEQAQPLAQQQSSLQAQGADFTSQHFSPAQQVLAWQIGPAFSQHALVSPDV